MITLRKLASLEPGTRIRKCVRILEEAFASIQQQLAIDHRYLEQVSLMVAAMEDVRLTNGTRNNCIQLSGKLSNLVTSQQLKWELADVIHRLHTDLGIEMADWDFFNNSGESLDQNRRSILPFSIVLDRVRSPFNVGSIFRTAESFGVETITLVSPSASPEHPRALRSARGCTKTVAWEQRPPQEIINSLQGKAVFAMELGGTDLPDFEFPEEGVMIVGSEELGTSPEFLAVADSSLGRVSIPLAGSKGSLNVSVAFGIVMQSWYSHIAVDR